MPCSIFLHVLQTKSSKVCFLNSRDRFSCDCNESDTTVGTTVLIPSTRLTALALPLSWLGKEQNHCKNHVCPPRFMWTCCLLSKDTKYVTYFFIYPASLLTEIYIFPVFIWYYAHTLLILRHWSRCMTWHWLDSTAKGTYFIFLIMNLSPCFSCHLSPTSCFLSTGCLSNLHGNRKGWEIVLVLLFCGKQLSTWCLYLVPFLVIKIHFKKLIILCVYLKLFAQSAEMDFKSGCIFTWTCGVIYESSVKAARTWEWAWSDNFQVSVGSEGVAEIVSWIRWTPGKTLWNFLHYLIVVCFTGFYFCFFYFKKGNHSPDCH